MPDEPDTKEEHSEIKESEKNVPGNILHRAQMSFEEKFKFRSHN